MRIVLRIQLIIGICMLISPWVFGYYEVTGALWVNVVFGLAVVFVSLFGILGGESTRSGNSESKKV